MNETKGEQMAAEWASTLFLEEFVVLGERIRQLRKERDWSQGDLAKKVGSVPPQISRYEHGRITPSLEMLVKLAEAFDVSTDYLLVEGSVRRPFRSPVQLRLSDRIKLVDELPEEDQASLLHIVEALLTKNKVKTLVAEAS